MIKEVAVEAIKVTAEYAKETGKEVAKKAKDISVDITKRIDTSVKSVNSRPDKVDITKRIPVEEGLIDGENIKATSTENYQKVRLEKEPSVSKLNNIKDKSIDNSVERINQKPTERNIDPDHKDCLTSSVERKEFANCSKGEWEAEPGNSLFRPEKKEAREMLSKYKQDGIRYKDGEPDFSKVSEATVKIDNMTSFRPENFRQANKACAEQWNEQRRDGRSDWTARDVDNWRKENKYSWHERLDTKTMDLVQRDIHEECKHFGGVSECLRKGF